MKKIIPISKPYLNGNEKNYIVDALDSGWVSSLGNYISDFESQFAKFCGTKYAVSASNGTVALHLALVSLGITKNDEVIIPDLSFIATANAVQYTGAKIVLVDIDPNSLCICPIALEKAITSKTKCIIPVHLYGQPAEMSAINNIAKKYNIFVVEDAAEAHGAIYNARKVGSFGDIGVFSFYGNKIITSGEGGMLTTNDEKLFNRIKFLRDHAMSKEKRYWHEEVGFNYRMTNLQAALGLAQLEQIDQFIAKREEIFSWYKSELINDSRIVLNRVVENSKSVYWMICVEIIGYVEENRDKLILKLKEFGIDSRPYFYPISEMPMYNEEIGQLNSKSVSIRGINLPIFFELTKDEVIFICSTLKSIL